MTKATRDRWPIEAVLSAHQITIVVNRRLRSELVNESKCSCRRGLGHVGVSSAHGANYSVSGIEWLRIGSHDGLGVCNVYDNGCLGH